MPDKRKLIVVPPPVGGEAASTISRDEVEKIMNFSYGGSGNGGNMDGVEARVAKLESDVEHIKNDLKDIKKDMKKLPYWFIGSFIAMLTAIIAIAQFQSSGTHGVFEANQRTVQVSINSIKEDSDRNWEQSQKILNRIDQMMLHGTNSPK